MAQGIQEPSCFIPFQTPVAEIPLPDSFTYPFYYEPHALSIRAAEQLQAKIEATDFNHNFGLPGNPEGLIIGKMFGVLVVQNRLGALGFLAAFSGKLGNSNQHEGFVPPVFDMLAEGSFFLEGIQTLNQLNEEVERRESSKNLQDLREQWAQIESEAKESLAAFRETMRIRKQIRKERRNALHSIEDANERAQEDAGLTSESIRLKHDLRRLQESWKLKLDQVKAALDTEESIIQSLKTQRKTTSGFIQQQLFESYNFGNARGDTRSLGSIFQEYSNLEPPSGSGECAAPKLMQYAYQHELKPIALAEFWWGASPKSEVRKHKQFYPSCRGKCEPILSHMLLGLHVDSNPMLELPETIEPLKIVYEDDQLLAINKPADFLSVPGNTPLPSIYDLVKAKYPEATGPLIVHRLDMATSGLLLLTKTKEANKFMQAQFINKTIKKRYEALLDGEILGSEGTVDLPLRLDIDDRPRQLVCYEHGKRAITEWNVVERTQGKTRIHLYPITGRTHQLRVHAAHVDGLNCPIVGDDLYGTRANRLHLHAAEIQFIHPTTREAMTLQVPADF